MCLVVRRKRRVACEQCSVFVCTRQSPAVILGNLSECFLPGLEANQNSMARLRFSLCNLCLSVDGLVGGR
jgi:hypothetical protein